MRMGVSKARGLLVLSAGLFRLIFLLLVLLVLSSIQACDQASGSENKIAIRALQLPIGSTYIGRRITAEPGTVAILASTSGTKDEETSLLKFKIESNGLSILLSFPMPNGRFEPWHGTPTLILEDGRILLKKWTGSSGDLSEFRNKIAYGILDPKTGKVVDVTPNNLNDTTAWACRAGPPFLWSDKLGLIHLTPDKSSKRYHIWQGAKTLGETGTIEQAIGLGQVFHKGKFSAAAILYDGRTLVFDQLDGTMKEVPSFNDTSKQLLKQAVKAKWPLYFVLAEGIAAFKSADESSTRFIITAGDGRTLTLPCRHVLDYKPDGSPRSDSEGNQLTFDSRPLRIEGSQQPPESISNNSVLIPISENSIGILDLSYARVIVLSAD